MTAAAGAAGAVQRAGGIAAGLAEGIGRGAGMAGGVILGILLLFLGAAIFARYALDAPIYWADEFCTLLLTWLAMAGVIAAESRGAHMSLTWFTARLAPMRRAAIRAVTEVVGLVFAGYATWGGWLHLSGHREDLMPTLELPLAWKLAALPVGFALLGLVQACRIWARHQPRRAIFMLLAGAVPVMAAAPLRNVIGPPEPLALAAILAVATFGLVAAGAAIGTAFGVATIGVLVLCTRVPLSILASRFEEGVSAYILLSVPLFVFLGHVIELTGLARAMVRVLALLFVRVKGGLSYCLLVAMYLVSGISGSKAADMAAVAPALFPEMRRRGGDEAELVALLSAAAAMSETIPPSLVLIAIGSVCGVSIAALFAAGLLPAFVGLLALAAVVCWQHRRRPAPAAAGLSFRALRSALLPALPAFALPVLIRFSVADGLATATEVSTVGLFYALLVGFVLNGRLPWRRMLPMLAESVVLTGAILFIIGAATGMAWALARSGISVQVIAAMEALPGGASGFLLVSVLLFVVLGSLLEGLPAIVLFGPLLFPAAKSLGIDEVHYAIVVVLAMGLGLFTPPFGIGFYAACAIGGADPNRAMSRAWPPLLALALAVLLVALVPGITRVRL